MAHYPYLIVGGGMTADAAVRGIRELDATTPIGVDRRGSGPALLAAAAVEGVVEGRPARKRLAQHGRSSV